MDRLFLDTRASMTFRTDELLMAMAFMHWHNLALKDIERANKGVTPWRL